MVEELAFYGIRNAEDVATCLNGYDQTAYPESKRVELYALLYSAGLRCRVSAGQRRRRALACIRGRAPQGEPAGPT